MVGSGPAAVLAVVESAAVSGFGYVGCRVVVRVCCWVWMVVMFVCVLRVSACALVCPVCVPAPPGVFLPVQNELPVHRLGVLGVVYV